MVEQRVIVIGGGLAGLSATIEAHKAGSKVVLIEKTNNLGGNSAKATSGINGCNSMYQEQKKIQDSHQLFYDDTWKSGGGLSDPTLLNTLVNNSADAIKFLSTFGLDLSNISQLGGHSAPRSHREPNRDGKPAPVGFDIMKTLKDYVHTLDSQQVTVLLEARMTGFVMDGNKVSGVKILKNDKEEEIRGTSVVMTTGGFCADRSPDSLLKKYAPQLAHLATTNGEFAVGDGIRLCEKINVDLVDMDKVQVHPTGFVDPKNPNGLVKFLGPEALRGCGGILLNHKGLRFCNELGLRDYVSGKIFDECENSVSYLVMNDEAVEKFGKAAFYFYHKVKGFAVQVNGTKGLSEYIGCPEENVKSVVSKYKFNRVNSKDEFGKKVFPVVFAETDTFYVCKITPSLHYSMGGVKINEKAQVVSQNKPVPGLYAAGEVTGGVHGKNRLGGNSLLECVVFGRIAGQSSVDYQNKL